MESEKLKKQIHYVYEYAAEAENSKDFHAVKNSLETVGEILEAIIDELTIIKKKESKLENIIEKIKKNQNSEENWLKNYKAY